MLSITSGRIAKPQKVVIYGPEGIGKTTLASHFPDPVFIDTEGSTYHMDVKRTPKPQSWQELLSQVEQISRTPGICKTLVLDTADWAEMICAKSVVDKYQKKSIEDFGYGKGYTYLQEEFGGLLNAFTDVINAGMNVVLTAHAGSWHPSRGGGTCRSPGNHPEPYAFSLCHPWQPHRSCSWQREPYPPIPSRWEQPAYSASSPNGHRLPFHPVAQISAFSHER